MAQGTQRVAVQDSCMRQCCAPTLHLGALPARRYAYRASEIGCVPSGTDERCRIQLQVASREISRPDVEARLVASEATGGELRRGELDERAPVIAPVAR